MKRFFRSAKALTDTTFQSTKHHPNKLFSVKRVLYLVKIEFIVTGCQMMSNATTTLQIHFLEPEVKPSFHHSRKTCRFEQPFSKFDSSLPLVCLTSSCKRRRIQNPAKHLKWNVFRKILNGTNIIWIYLALTYLLIFRETELSYIFSKKSFSYISGNGAF